MAAEGSKEMVVLYPSPSMGHLVSMVELGKLLVRHGLSVTILIVDPPCNAASATSFISRASSANPSISFHRLPPVSLPPNASRNPVALAFDLSRLSNPNLLDFLRSCHARALVIDFFCAVAIDVATELHLPCYCFFTSNASGLAAFFHLPFLHSQASSSFKELGSTPLTVPGIPPIPADHMPGSLLDFEDESYKDFLHVARTFPELHGIIVNTFESLEQRAIEAIRKGHCTPSGRLTPPVYCIGPLITSDSDIRAGGKECLSWLNSQPRASVVFLCFGSLGLFSAAQLQEIAFGVERSGQRFLWVVRSPPSDEPAKRLVAPPEPDVDALLPEGFLQRTKEQGLVVKSWAPQVAVLTHESVGGFVTHCGWNSVLEAVCAGVPMIAWPLYAEQWMNKVFLVEEMRLAAEIKGYNEELVSAEEVEARIRWLMDSDGGRELRKRALAARESAMAALRVGGSSYVAAEQLMGQCKQSRQACGSDAQPVGDWKESR